MKFYSQWIWILQWSLLFHRYWMSIQYIFYCFLTIGGYLQQMSVCRQTWRRALCRLERTRSSHRHSLHRYEPYLTCQPEICNISLPSFPKTILFDYQLINEKPQVIQEYESGKAIPNQQIIGKLERALGTKLRGKKWSRVHLTGVEAFKRAWLGKVTAK